MTSNARRAGVLALLVAAGCGPAAPPREPVAGKVTVGGQPVTAATVFFENAAAGVGLNAPLDAGGNYVVRTHLGDGLPPGTYKVAVMPGGVMSPDEQGPKAHEAKAARPRPAAAIPERYRSTATSGLTVEVKAGGNPPFDFALTP